MLKNNFKEPYLESLKLPRIVESLTALLHVLIVILVLFLILMRIIILLVLIVVLVVIVKASEEGGPAALAEGPVALGNELLLLLLLNISAVTSQLSQLSNDSDRVSTASFHVTAPKLQHNIHS
jgi:hypothetical protein